MSIATKQKLTPMFEQYLSIKEQYPNALLFYRMGDFYELFFTDAEVAARELQLTLTARNPHAENPIAMCGVPWHSAKNYINQLINKGYTVALCDQIQDPREAKGLVERAVTQVITPGTTLDEDSLEAKRHCWLAAAFWNKMTDTGAVAWADVSTGVWAGLQVRKRSEMWQWILKMSPRELLIPEGFELPDAVKNGNDGKMHIVSLPTRTAFQYKRALERLLRAQGVQEAAALGLEKRSELVCCCGALLAYLEQTQLRDITHFVPFTALDPAQYMVLDEVTERNLELFQCLDGRKGVGTLRAVLDHTHTPMGGRLLEDRLHNPWREKQRIQETHDVVAFLVENETCRTALSSLLQTVQDLERLSTRVSLNRTVPNDLCAVRQSLAVLPTLYQTLTKLPSLPDSSEVSFEHLPTALRSLVHHWDDLADIQNLLTLALVDNPPTQITEGGLFKQGYHAELDELIDLVDHGEQKLNELLLEEQKTVPKLKLGYNRVFGYYFELSKASGGRPPAHFVRRQTLANAERFSTPALVELEQKRLSASEMRNSLEYKLFQTVRDEVAACRTRLLFMAHCLAQLDFWQALADVAVRNMWNRPELDDSGSLEIREGRHPVIEACIGQNSFVPNDVIMDRERHFIMLTGPNMSGKSTILRQTALICLLAQMGSFVPARVARIGLCDRIFSRVGASDNLSQGQSTFMVEMIETARILRQASKRSLVILDEIGRGTSTFDGLALAWAVAEELVRRANGQIRTLFATHYHELAALEKTLHGVHTMNVAIHESGGEIVFLRRLVPGPADRSYGIEVAKLAGVPQGVVQRAREVLAKLEQQRPAVSPVQALMPGVLPGLTLPTKPETQKLPPPKPDHPLVVALNNLNPEQLTPLEAFARLVEWKKLWGTPKKDV